MVDLSGKTALVTGASTGIGAAIAIMLAEQKANVAVNYFKSEDCANSVLEKVKRRSDGMLISADIKREKDIEEMVGAVLAKYNKIDILINNAGGLLERAPIDKVELSVWYEIMDVNITGTMLTTKTVLSTGMLERGTGRIINMSSVAARTGGGPGAVPYATSKAAIIGFTKGLALELAATKITVNCLAPGLIDTPFHKKYSNPDIKNRLLTKVPNGRWGTPEEVAIAALFLCDDRAEYITGQTIDINGGWWMD